MELQSISNQSANSIRNNDRDVTYNILLGDRISEDGLDDNDDEHDEEEHHHHTIVEKVESIDFTVLETNTWKKVRIVGSCNILY